MGSFDGEIANLWRHEFNKHNIGYYEIVLIGNNLGELDRPEFIPNVFQLIGIVKKIYESPEFKIRHERISSKRQKGMKKAEVIELRDKTKELRSKTIESVKMVLCQKSQSQSTDSVKKNGR